MKKSKLKKALATAGVLSVALLSGVTLASCDDGGDSGVSEVDLTVTKAEAITSVSSYKDKGNYRDTQKTEIDNIVKDAEAKINAATSKESIDSIVSEAKSKLDAVKTSAELDKEENDSAVKEAKETKIAAINTLYATYKEADYRTAEWQALTKLVNDAKAEVNAMNNTTNINAYSTDALKTKLDAVKTNATLTAEELAAAKNAKLKAIDDVAAKYPEENYRTEEKTDRATAISEAKASVNGYTVIADVNAYTTTTLEDKLKALKTDAAYTAEELQSAKTSKKAEIDAVLSTYNENDYSSANWTIITNYISAAKAAIDALTTKEAVTSYDLTTLKAKVADVKTAAQEASDLANAKETKMGEVTAFMANYNESDYSVSNWAKIQGYKSTVSSDINALTTVNEVTSYSLETFRANVKAVQTKAQELKAAKDAKLAEITTVANKYPETNYRADEKQTRATAIKTAEDAVNNCTTVEAVNAYTTTELENKLKALTTDAAYTAQELQAAKDAMLSQINTLENGYKENDYSASNWKTLSGYITKAKADVNALTTKAAVEAYDIATLTKNVAAVPTLAQELTEAKTAKIKEIETLVATYASNKYSAAKKVEFDSAVNSAKETVNGYTVVADVTAYAVATLKTTLDGISTAVAGINTTYYDTLQAAITGAGDTESTVVLYADVLEDITVAKTQTIILDLNGYKLTNSTTHTISNAGTLTIKDTSTAKTGTIDNVTHQRGALYNTGNVTIESGTLERSKEAGASTTSSGGNSWYTIFSPKGNITVVGGTIKNNGIFSSMIKIGQGSTTLDEATFTMTGGTLNGGLYNIFVDEYAKATITGGTFILGIKTAGGYILNWGSLNVSNISLTGEASQTIIFTASGEEGYSGTTTVGKNTTISGELALRNGATITFDESISLENVNFFYDVFTFEQVETALANDKCSTIRLQADITGDIEIKSTQTIELNLNGHTLTNSTSHTILNRGILTINDSSSSKTGKVISVVENKSALRNADYATCTINAGYFYRNGKPTADTTNHWFVVDNYATMTINGGTFEFKNANGFTIANGFKSWAPVEGQKATLTINSATITGSSGIRNDTSGEVIINDATITVDYWALSNQAKVTSFASGQTFENGYVPTSTINGGVFTSTLNIPIYNAASMVINDGTFNGTESGSVYIVSKNTILNGGKYTENIGADEDGALKDYLGEGKSYKKDGDYYIIYSLSE